MEFALDIKDKGDPGIGFKLTHDNNYDMDNKRLVNVGDSIGMNDVCTKEYIKNTLMKTFYIQKYQNSMLI